MKKVDFFADAVSDYYIENYMFAAIPNHPIIISAFENALYLLNNLKELYPNLLDCPNDGLPNTLTYQPFVEAFIANANRYDTYDIAIPPNELGEQNIPDMSSLETYYVCNANEGESQVGLSIVYKVEEELFEKIFGIFKEKLYCPVFNISIGEDGENGGTWMEMRSHNEQEALDLAGIVPSIQDNINNFN